ncbi:hypothetical protein EV182_000757 [Spiromyces aspiralis]|uniref:Uncharacterized protein n=1 Tax=Spiromyces aspiralis TaxID=68401 RepID=A0ACC1HXL9_9FUNG|nr:hypothetical protein EV182_000757 [Spiromyces aspiralis]
MAGSFSERLKQLREQARLKLKEKAQSNENRKTLELSQQVAHVQHVKGILQWKDPLVEPYSRLHVKERVMDLDKVNEWMARAEYKSLRQLARPNGSGANNAKDICTHPWHTFGVVESQPRVRQARTGDSYVVMEVTDLRGTSMMVLRFGREFVESTELKIGDIVGIGGGEVRCYEVRWQ